LRIIDADDVLSRSYVSKIATSLLDAKDAITQVGGWPARLSGSLSEVEDFIREETLFVVLADQVNVINARVGGTLLKRYLSGHLLGLPPGLSPNQVAPLISELLAHRIRSMGVTSTDFRLLLDVARRLPSARGTVIRGGKRS